MQEVRLGYIFLFQTNDNDNIKHLCFRLYFSKLCRLKILKFNLLSAVWLTVIFVSRSKTRAWRRNSIWFSVSRYSYLGARPLGTRLKETGKQIKKGLNWFSCPVFLLSLAILKTCMYPTSTQYELSGVWLKKIQSNLYITAPY